MLFFNIYNHYLLYIRYIVSKAIVDLHDSRISVTYIIYMIGLKRSVAVDVLGIKRQKSKSILGNKISHYNTHHHNNNNHLSINPDNSDGLENGNTHAQQEQPKKLSGLV